jgi:hypothetical protein
MLSALKIAAHPIKTVCYARKHMSPSIFANGVDQETEPDAAIPPKTGAPGYAVFACLGWKEWPHITDPFGPQY